MAQRKNEFGLPKEVTNGLYNPAFLPDELQLNEFIEDPDRTRKQTQNTLKKKVEATARPSEVIGVEGISVPLSEKEAEEVDKIIEKQLADIAITRQRIASIRGFIDDVASPTGGKELSFKLDISRKPTIKRAVRKIFGFKTDEITYSMYKQALEAKRLIEKEESDLYVNGE